MRRKVAIIGAGNVGATCAQRIAERALADVALVDVVEGLAAGKALDLTQAAALEGHDGLVSGSSDYSIIEGAEVVVVTAGMARKPGMSRGDLLEANAKITSAIIPQVIEHCPKAILITVTNPLDAMTYLTWRITGWPQQRVMGMAGVLDSARLRTFVAQRLKVSAKEIQTMVLGGHGDSMVPLLNSTTVKGVPITQLLPTEEIEQLIDRTRKGGAEIVKLLKTGSAFYAPASSAADMVQAILLDEHRLLPACVYLKSSYRLKDVFCGVPIRLGARGVEEVLEVKLSDQEQAALETSAKAVRAEMDTVDTFLSNSVKG